MGLSQAMLMNFEASTLQTTDGHRDVSHYLSRKQNKGQKNIFLGPNIWIITSLVSTMLKQQLLLWLL